METYIVRIYRSESDEREATEALGVVEVAGQETKQYFTKIDEITAIFQELRGKEPNAEM